MSSFYRDLIIAIGCLLGFGIVAHNVISSIVEKEFAKLDLSILKTRSEVLETQKDLKELEKDLKTLIFMQIEKKKENDNVL